jgi:hypothetical protein
MEPILKTAVLILMGANAAGADLGIACENWSQILLGIDREGGGRSRLPLSQARIGGGGEGGRGGEGVKGVKDTQQHPGRGGVGHWRISEACKHTKHVCLHTAFLAQRRDAKLKVGKWRLRGTLGQRSRFGLHQVSDATQGALAWRSPNRYGIGFEARVVDRDFGEGHRKYFYQM